MPNLAPLSVPVFNRIEEYVGPWAIEPSTFNAIWKAWNDANLAAHVNAGPPSPRPVTQMEMIAGKNGQNVAVVKATGLLMKQASSFGGTSTIQLRRDIRAAANDPTVSSILLAIDSPGGTVAGTEALALDVKSARRKKPVWAQIEDLGASAAYWFASQADAVYASSNTTQVGSIGTIVTIYDTSKAAEDQGVKTLVFSTGPLKGAGADGAPVTEEQASYFQSMVNGMQTYFDAAVKSGRGLTNTQLAAAKTGGVFSAADALDKRLIDGIRSLDSTLEALIAAK